MFKKLKKINNILDIQNLDKLINFDMNEEMKKMNENLDNEILKKIINFDIDIEMNKLNKLIEKNTKNINNNNNISNINIESANSNIKPQIIDNLNNNDKIIFKSKINFIFSEILKNLLIKKNEDQLIFSRDKNEYGTKYFYLINKNDRNYYIDNGINYYELLHKNDDNNDISFKLYLDIDISLDKNNINNDDNTIDNYIINLCDKIILELNKKYNLNILNEKNNYYVLIASTNEKISYHIIFNNLLFNSIKYMKEEMNYLKLVFSEDILFKNNFIDLNPYKTNQQFRLYNNSKFNKNNKLVFSKYHITELNKTDNIIDDKFIDNYIETHKYNTFITTFKQNNIINIINENNDIKKLDINDIKKNNNFCDNYNINNNIIIQSQKDLLEHLKFNDYKKLFMILENFKNDYYDTNNKWWKIIEILKQFYNDYSIIIRFSKLSKKYNDDIEKNNKKIYDKIILKKISYEEFNKNIRILLKYLELSNKDIYNKINKDIKQLNIFKLQYEQYYEQKKLKQIEDYYSIKDKQYKNINFIDIKKDELTHIEDKYFLNKNIIMNNNNYEVIILKSDMGSGKNTTIYNYINQMKDTYQSILIISARILYSINIIKEFKEKCDIDFVDYRENKNNIFNDNYLCISIYSLCKIDIEKKYDLIIFDETETNLNVFQSHNCHKNYRENYERLEKLFKSAIKIICADRDINKTSLDFIETFNKKTILLNNENIFYNKLCIQYKFKDTLLKKMYDDIKNNKKVVLFNNSKKAIQSIEKNLKTEYPNKKIICHYSNSEDNKKLKKSNINNLWDCDILLYNICITVGISYDKKNHFDSFYAIVDNVNMRDFFQSTLRIRNFNENKINVYLTDNKTLFNKELNNNLLEDDNKVKNLIDEFKNDIENDFKTDKKNNLLDMLKLFVQNNPNMSITDFYYSLIIVMPNNLKNIRLRALIEKKLNENSFIIFKYFLSKQNYTYELNENKDDFDGIDKLKINDDEFYDNILKIYNELLLKCGNEKNINLFINNERNNLNSKYNMDDLTYVKNYIYFNHKFEINKDDKKYCHYSMKKDIFLDYLDNKHSYHNFYNHYKKTNIFNIYLNKINNGEYIEMIDNLYEKKNIINDIFNKLDITDNIYKTKKYNKDALNDVIEYIDNNKDNLIKNFNLRIQNKLDYDNIIILRKILKLYGINILSDKKNRYKILEPINKNIVNIKLKEYEDKKIFLDVFINENEIIHNYNDFNDIIIDNNKNEI